MIKAFGLLIVSSAVFAILMQFHHCFVNTNPYILITTNINILAPYLQGLFLSKTIEKPFVSCVVTWFLPAYRSLDSNKIQRLDAGIFSNMAQLKKL